MRGSRFKPELIRSVCSVFVSAVAAGMFVTALSQAITDFSVAPDRMPFGVDGPPPLLEMGLILVFFGGLMALLAGPFVFAARWAGEIVGGRFGRVAQYVLAVLAVSNLMLLLNGGRPPFNAYTALAAVVTAAGAVAIANWLSSRDRQEEPCAS
jgi:hypothetical protein